MSALDQARQLLALADKLRAGDAGEGRARPDPDVDTCDMPLGDGRRCEFPGDHGGGCGVYEPCLCSHDRTLHDRVMDGEAGCGIFVCGCRRFRAKAAAA